MDAKSCLVAEQYCIHWPVWWRHLLPGTGDSCLDVWVWVCHRLLCFIRHWSIVSVNEKNHEYIKYEQINEINNSTDNILSDLHCKETCVCCKVFRVS